VKNEIPVDRSWEVWGSSGVAHLLHYWGSPDDPDVDGRHIQLLNFVAHLIDENVSVLDVCCGMGHFYPFVKHKVWKYLGIDNSPEMLAEAKHAFGEDLFELYDVFELGHLEEFHTVVNISLIQHLPDHLIQPAIEQMWSRTACRLILEAPVSVRGAVAVGEEKHYAPGKLLLDRPIKESFLIKIVEGLPELKSYGTVTFNRRYISTIFMVMRDRVPMYVQ
jgi:SAM-dependent methyltransferase